jgi:hypothetical protein
MRLAVALAVVLAVGCESRGAGTRPAKTESATTAPGSAVAATRPVLVDLAASAGSTALAPVRAAFNAHRGEVRFLTLLSPT